MIYLDGMGRKTKDKAGIEDKSSRRGKVDDMVILGLILAYCPGSYWSVCFTAYLVRIVVTIVACF